MQNTLEPSQPWQPKTDKTAKNPATQQTLKALTNKQQAFVKHLIDNPKASATAAARATYGKPDKPVSDGTAQQIAHDNLSKPNIQLELAKHSKTAEYSLLEVLDNSTKYSKTFSKEGASYAAVAVQAANSILDRVHGKATQRIEQQSQAVVIHVDLTGVTAVENPIQEARA